MAYDITLGGQTFAMDNPALVLGLLDNIAKVQKGQQDTKKQEEQHQKLLDTLAKYDISPPTTNKSFEDVARNYRGAVSQGEGQYPEEVFEKPRPQVRNLKQLTEIIQGLKGLPQEYAGSIISRLTGIADQSQQQLEAITKLRAALSQPSKEATLQQKEKAGDLQQEQFATRLKQQEAMQLRGIKAAYLQNILKSSVNSEERKNATKALMELIKENESVGYSNFRKESK